GAPRDQADHQPGASGGISAVGVSPREGNDRPNRAPERASKNARLAPAFLRRGGAPAPKAAAARGGNPRPVPRGGRSDRIHASASARPGGAAPASPSRFNSGGDGTWRQWSAEPAGHPGPPGPGRGTR